MLHGILRLILLLLPVTNQVLAEDIHLGRPRSDHVEDKRLDAARFIPPAVVDLLDQISLALNASVGDLADLLRVERFPRLIIEVFVEGNDEDGVNEVDESVTNVAHVVEVLRQVEIVVAALVVPVYALQKHLFRVLVRDVADHDRRALVQSRQDAVEVDGKLRVASFSVGLGGRRL